MTTSTLNPPEQGLGARTSLGRFLRGVFSAFDQEGVTYAVLRNAQGLPDHTRNDVDLLLAPQCLEPATKIIRRLAKQHQWTEVARLEKFEYRCLVLKDRDGARGFLSIDLVTGLNYRFYPYGDARHGLNQRLRHPRGFWRVPEGCEAAVALLKELLARGTLRESCRQTIAHGVTRDGTYFKKILEIHLPPDQVDALAAECADGNWDALSQRAPALRKTITRPRWALLPRAAGYLMKTIRHYLRPPLSCFAVIIGPDGSGKTSLMQAVSERLFENPFKMIRCYKSGFQILPPLKSVKNLCGSLLGQPRGKAAEPEPGRLHSGMIRPNSVFLSLLYVAYYSLDLFLGRLMLRRLRGQCALVLFDRYYYDYYYQIGNRNVPGWYLALFECLVPKPDLIFAIDRDAEDIFRNKPELSVEEIKLEQRIIHQLTQSRKGSRTVAGQDGLAHSAHAMERMILEHTGPAPSAGV